MGIPVVPHTSEFPKIKYIRDTHTTYSTSNTSTTVEGHSELQQIENIPSTKRREDSIFFDTEATAYVGQ